jgi:ribonuclease P protein component
VFEFKLSFRRQDKLIGAKAHKNVFTRGKRKRSKYFQAIFVSKNDKTAHLGLIFPKKIQPRAVVRNRLKRINREWFRQHKATLNLDVIIQLVSAGKGVDVKELEQDCLNLWQSVHSTPSDKKS